MKPYEKPSEENNWRMRKAADLFLPAIWSLITDII
jgi:hypothetical protein